jgi:hypothetical protein
MMCLRERIYHHAEETMDNMLSGADIIVCRNITVHRARGTEEVVERNRNKMDSFLSTTSSVPFRILPGRQECLPY